MPLAGLQREEVVNARVRRTHVCQKCLHTGAPQILGGQEEGHLPTCTHSEGAGSGVHSEVYGVQLRVTVLSGF